VSIITAITFAYKLQSMNPVFRAWPLAGNWLAASRSSPRFFPNSLRPPLPSSVLHHRAPTANSPRSLSLLSYNLPRKYQRQPTLPRQLRHCSYRRNKMCRLTGEGSDPSTININQTRQILPADVKPIHYHLTLEPNLTTFQYNGEVAIEYVVQLSSLDTPS
jgi:hypothetical protein